MLGDSAFPLTRDLVLIGGGHAHALVLRRWGMNPLPGVRVTVINPDPTAPYTGMLPGHIAGHYPRDALEIDLVRLARFAGARLILGRALGIHRSARSIEVSGRGPVTYDIASIDIGITSEMPEIPGFGEHGVAAKPLGRYARTWAAFVNDLKLRGARATRVVVLGGGVGGVELAMAMAHRLHGMGVEPRITVLEQGARALPGLGAGASRALGAQMDRLGVALICGARARRLTADGVELDDGRTLPSDFTLGAAGARPQGWLKDTGLDLVDGYVAVEPTLQTIGDPALFAVGDCAHMVASPRPKAGVFAVRQAPALHDNLRAALSGGAMRRYRPQRDFLKLISTGGKAAVADKYGLRLEGGLLWRLKDRIDRKFMNRFQDLPRMRAAPLPRAVATGLREEMQGDKPLCGGCGSKVGRAGLAQAIPALSQRAAARLAGTGGAMTGPGDDAAVLPHGAGFQVITTDHLRAFTEDFGLMARIAAVHALGDVWAMGAAPQAAFASIILPRMSAAMQARTLREIMAAAATVFDEAGAAILGGHTSLGAELTLGFTVTGLTNAPVEKGGARAGDALILTKPLGSGVILAAEMLGAAPGETVADALNVMARPQDAVARILRDDARAMTDVTGFGLAGHMLEMIEASNTGAEIRLDSLPFLPGAVDLAAAGHHASVTPENRRVAVRMKIAPELRADPRLDLLFDPQTAGGMLAAVPRGRAEALLGMLHAAGETGWAIGHMAKGDPVLTVA